MPPLSAFDAQLKSTDGRQISTTMALVRVLNTLVARQEHRQAHRSRSWPTKARTFGMEGMFRQYGIYLAASGSSTRPQDADQLCFYKEAKTGQILQEGINEAGAMASWIAAATSYSTSQCAR